MNLEDLSRMSEAELREKANENLIPPSFETPSGSQVFLKPDLSAAQFFIDEIERRAGDAERKRQRWITTRDLLLELVVIALIGGELYYGIHGGNQQLAVLQTLNTSAGQQLELLKQMNTNAANTANILNVLKDEQEKALAAQQQTLQLVGQMNGSLRTTLGLNFAPALTLTYDQPQKRFVYENFGKTNLFLWGQKFGEQPIELAPEPRVIAPGAGYQLTAEPVIANTSKRISKGQTEQNRLQAFLKTADGKKYTASFYVIALFKEDTLSFNVQEIGIKEGGW